MKKVKLSWGEASIKIPELEELARQLDNADDALLTEVITAINNFIDNADGTYPKLLRTAPKVLDFVFRACVDVPEDVKPNALDVIVVMAELKKSREGKQFMEILGNVFPAASK